MAQGSVGGGNQNSWKDDGIIYVTPPAGGLPFKKENATTSATRNDSACWVADTPVKWETNVSQAEASRADVDGIDMLVTYEADGKTIKEYHPVITFFNEVMAELMRNNHLNKINDLKNRNKAKALWNYLAEKYPI